MRIAIHGRSNSPDLREIVLKLFETLQNHQAEISVSQDFIDKHASLLDGLVYQVYEPFKEHSFDLFVSLGGDGTFLETLTHVGMAETPIIGINIGRLGFLAITAKDQIVEALNNYFAGNYSIDRRSLVAFEASVDLFNGINYGLNEFSVIRKETSSMIVVRVYLNGHFLNAYWADGLMISTPTGSTGYSLSCGGPILLPQTKNFVITPVSPHNLNIRPLIVPDSSEITLEVESRNTNFLVSLDSRSRTAEGGILLKVKKAPFYANLVRMEGSEFIETLRSKLSWGLDKRN